MIGEICTPFVFLMILTNIDVYISYWGLNFILFLLAQFNIFDMIFISNINDFSVFVYFIRKNLDN